ncbi:hypothetical protein N431DRAFT_490146 [Stipitochalara longipes BDJ]|nr:hypothetical protein N431DRAFT_490146 [Stipitochalara longipes BDJ]
MSLLRRPITLLLLGVHLASFGSCIFLSKQNSGPGLPRLEAGSGFRGPFNESLAGMSFLRDSVSDASSLFSRQAVCSNGVTTCNGYTCDKCESCCGAYTPPATPCNPFAFGVCCTDGDFCSEGSACWYQVGGTKMGCCPIGLTGCFTTPFSCCYPGSTCGSSGCTGTATVSVPYVTVTYTSTVSRFLTNTITVTSPSGAASTVSVTILATSFNTTTYTATITTSVPQLKPRNGILEILKGQLQKYELAPRAVSVSTWTASEYAWVTIWTTFTQTSTFLSGQVTAHTLTYTSYVFNLVSVTTTHVVTITTAGPSSQPTTATLILTTTAPAPPSSPGVTTTTLVQPTTVTTANSKTSTISTSSGGAGGGSITVPGPPVPITSASPMSTGNGTIISGLSTGAKAGIGAGVGVSAVASLAFLTLFLLGRRKSKSERGVPDTTTGGENVENTKSEGHKPELPSPGPYVGPMPDKSHRDAYSYMPVYPNPVEPAVKPQENLSPSSPTPSSTRFSELGGNSSTQGRAEVSAQPMGFQAPVGSDYEYYELQANEAGRPRSEMRG